MADVENGNTAVLYGATDGEITPAVTQEVKLPPNKNPGSLRYNAGASAEDTFSLEAPGADFADYVEVPLGDDLEEVVPEIDYSIVKKYMDEFKFNIKTRGVRAASNFPFSSVPSFTDTFDNLVDYIKSGGVNAEEVKALVRKCLTVLEKKGHKSYYSAAFDASGKHQQQFNMLVNFLWEKLTNFDFSLETDKLTADTIMHLLGSVNDEKQLQGFAIQQKFLREDESLLPSRILLMSEAISKVAAEKATDGNAEPAPAAEDTDGNAEPTPAVAAEVVAAALVNNILSSARSVIAASSAPATAKPAPAAAEEEDLDAMLDRLQSEKVLALTREANAKAELHAQIQRNETLRIENQELKSRLNANLPEHKQTSSF